MPTAPRKVVKFFHFLRVHITLASNGMGVDLKESRSGLMAIMEKQGYNYEIYENFITEYENKLLEQYYENKEKANP